MSGYVIADVDWAGEDARLRYMELLAPTLEQFGHGAFGNPFQTAISRAATWHAARCPGRSSVKAGI